MFVLLEKKQEKKNSLISAFKNYIRHPVLRNIILLKLTAGMGAAVFHSSFSLAASDRFKLNPKDMGFLMSYIGGLVVLVNGFWIGLVTKRFSEKVIVKTSLLSLTICYLCLSVTNSYWQILILLIPICISSTSMYTITQSIMTKSVSKDETGTVLGLDHATRTFCGVLSPILGGYILQYFGYSFICLFGAFTVLISIAFA